MVNTPTILNVNGTGPALLHIPTDTAHVLLELYPGQNLRLTPYLHALIPSVESTKPLVLHHLGHVDGSRGRWTQELPWYETMDAQSLEFLRLDPDILLACIGQDYPERSIAIFLLEYKEWQSSSLATATTLIQESRDPRELQSKLLSWAHSLHQAAAQHE